MYIISKKKDYYDGVVGTMGVDKEIVYERKERIIENPEQFPQEFTKVNDVRELFRKTNHFHNVKFYPTRENSKYEEVNPIIVGFCGKLYLGFKLEYELESEGYRLPEKKIDIFYEKEDVKKYIQSHHWGRNLDDDYNYIENYDALHIFREYNTPVFIYDVDYTKRLFGRETFIINPLLKEYEFYKVFDSFTAFQEIQMFISGVLGIGEKETVEISDKDKIEQHGYDRKWSFRKEPTKKKK